MSIMRIVIEAKTKFKSLCEIYVFPSNLYTNYIGFDIKTYEFCNKMSLVF